MSALLIALAVVLLVVIILLATWRPKPKVQPKHKPVDPHAYYDMHR